MRTVYWRSPCLACSQNASRGKTLSFCSTRSTSHWSNTPKSIHFSDCVVCFTQVYDQCLPTRRIRDYDNLEEKQLLDVLSTFVMADDTGLLCDAYNTAALGEKDCTRISVMEKKRFPAWLAEHENTLKSISDF